MAKSPLLRPPYGLQNLLDSQNFGLNPNEINREAQPTVDLGMHLKMPLLRRATAVNTSVTSINESVEVIVPNEELWELLVLSGNCTNSQAAGARVRLRLRMGIPTADAVGGTGLQNINLYYGQAEEVLDATSTAALAGVGVNFPPNVLVGPDTRLICQVSDIDLNGGTDVSLRSDVLYRKYLI